MWRIYPNTEVCTQIFFISSCAMRGEVSDGRKNRGQLIPAFEPHSRLSKFVRLLSLVHFLNSNLFEISTCGLNNLQSIKLTKSVPAGYFLFTWKMSIIIIMCDHWYPRTAFSKAHLLPKQSVLGTKHSWNNGSILEVLKNASYIWLPTNYNISDTRFIHTKTTRKVGITVV